MVFFLLLYCGTPKELPKSLLCLVVSSCLCITKQINQQYAGVLCAEDVFWQSKGLTALTLPGTAGH